MREGQLEDGMPRFLTEKEHALWKRMTRPERHLSRVIEWQRRFIMELAVKRNNTGDLFEVEQLERILSIMSHELRRLSRMQNDSR